MGAIITKRCSLCRKQKLWDPEEPAVTQTRGVKKVSVHIFSRIMIFIEKKKKKKKLLIFQGCAIQALNWSRSDWLLYLAVHHIDQTILFLETQNQALVVRDHALHEILGTHGNLYA